MRPTSWLGPWVAAAVLFSGCIVAETGQAPEASTPAASGPSTATGSPFKAGMRTIEQSNMGNSEMPADPIRRAIMDKAAWESFWNSYVSNREPRPAAPAIDFAKEFVVVVSQGQKSSAGYNLTIDDVAWEASDEAEARFTETTPGPTCGNAAVMTHPIHMVAAKRPSGADPAVRFEAKTATKAC